MPHSRFSVSYLAIRLVASRAIFSTMEVPTLDAVKWTISSIVILSASYTYFVNKLTTTTGASPPTNPSVLLLPRQGLNPAQVHRLRAAKKARTERDREEQRRLKLASARPFRLLDLPPELVLAILGHCTSPATYSSLVRTSTHCQKLVFHACLSRIPIRLITPEQVCSFDLFLRCRPPLIPEPDLGARMVSRTMQYARPVCGREGVDCRRRRKPVTAYV
ncbi:hypothetical protein NLJ89_g10117 [Agrocybe chaxingu]|uniref:F-box domain-containing protein n=1 Tax=Agrocybe chaxingu TaxID=84603 RepID=A0A9W8JPG2_9AGAR|nr:hypothetical protein NLJ89_g10117 [Agrocybe chaxingu]